MISYKPLDFFTYEFRLLKVLPNEDGDDNTVIRCSLDHELLLDPPKYRALSYCWGDLGATETILVNGDSVHITANLHAALLELRPQGLTTLWIDALCINQQDVAERGFQVTRMGLIYSRAEEVIVWLGSESNDSGNAMACLVSPGKQLGNRSKAAVTSLLQRPFWKRVWIIQEVSKSRKLRVLCGSASIRWEQMVDSLERWHVVPPTIKALQKFRTAEQLHMGLDRPELISGLFQTVQCLSTDPRDKIFAILGLCSDGPFLVQSPNYVQSPERIYFDLLLALVSGNRRLNYLARQGLTGSRQTPHDAPQADWTSITHGVFFWIVNALYPRKKHQLEGYVMDRMAYESFPIRQDDGTGVENFPCLTFAGLTASVVAIDYVQPLPIGQYYHRDDDNIPDTLHEASIDEMRHVLTCFGNALYLPYFSNTARKKQFPPGALVASSMTYLCRKSRPNHMPTFRAWYEENRHLEYRGRTLKTWANMYAQTPEFNFEVSALLSDEKVVRDAVRSVCVRIIEGIRWVTQNNLSLATGSETSVLQLVPQEVEDGDLLCRIRYSKAPIFVRHQGNDFYTFVVFSCSCPWLRPTKSGEYVDQGFWGKKLNKKERWDWVSGNVDLAEEQRGGHSLQRRLKREQVWETITIQ
ncbi:heterokaryon incompatibility protein-domain-containing protein [Leptodontidium sp. MPI-SDFR-AT-0119]|nr:heterokaryon incompatibility protein-domain-containing protein [Leptodontidium sp. MPI-SDFR-AT-0119]